MKDWAETGSGSARRAALAFLCGVRPITPKDDLWRGGREGRAETESVRRVSAVRPGKYRRWRGCRHALTHRWSPGSERSVSLHVSLVRIGTARFFSQLLSPVSVSELTREEQCSCF